jgi:hypothetical protein
MKAQAGETVWVADGAIVKARDFWPAQVTSAGPAGVTLHGGATVPWSQVHRTCEDAIRAAIAQLGRDLAVLQAELAKEHRARHRR